MEETCLRNDLDGHDNAVCPLNFLESANSMYTRIYWEEMHRLDSYIFEKSVDAEVYQLNILEACIKVDLRIENHEIESTWEFKIKIFVYEWLCKHKALFCVRGE